MWVVYLEVAFAFVLAVLIVWWTWPKKRSGEKRSAGEERDARPGRGDDDQ
jgi:hypothetical protein